ncbi:hypothetical protein HGRIS_009301 [Hohenbuehelia grisea]|uniref:Uncharacterized protein n=1 Tax=Hohenbuehelia grisea TaxID=104357 RepID=A0ABR3J0Z1_9AGAR
MFGRLSALLAVAVLAAAAPHNDWSQACFHGECAYEMTTNSGSSGLLKLYGSPQSISDITAAAGWVVLDCDPHSMVQQIRLVCKSDNADAAGCGHLFEHGGATDKLVRLPENCGSGPFARIAKASVASDQSIPAHMRRHLERRGEAQPEVHLLDIDTNFAAVNTEKAGGISFRFVGFNQPGVSMDGANINWDVNSLSFIDDAVTWVKIAAINVYNKVEETFVAVKEDAVTIGKHIVKLPFELQAWRTIQALPSYLKDATAFNHRMKSAQVEIPLTLPSTKLLSAKAEACLVQANLDVTVGGSGNVKTVVGLIVEGSVIPPSIKDFGAYIDLSADVTAKLDFDIGIDGSVESGRIPLIDPIGIPAISVPGIFAVGPWLQLEASARAVMNIQMNIETEVSYKVDNLKLWYPRKLGGYPQGKKFQSKDSELKLSAAANIEGYGFLEGHIIPSIKLGVLMGNDKAHVAGATAKATVNAYVEADVFARLTLEAAAQASGSIVKVLGHGVPTLDALIPEKLRGLQLVPRSFVLPYSLKARELAAAQAAGWPGPLIEEVSAGASACVWLDLGVAIRGGATAEFFGWEPADVGGQIWAPEKPLQVFSKCWTFGEGVTPLLISKARSKDVSFFDSQAKATKCPAKPRQAVQKAQTKVPAKEFSS